MYIRGYIMYIDRQREGGRFLLWKEKTDEVMREYIYIYIGNSIYSEANKINVKSMRCSKLNHAMYYMFTESDAQDQSCERLL